MSATGHRSSQARASKAKARSAEHAVLLVVLLLGAPPLTACYKVSCATLLVPSTLTVEFRSLPQPLEGLEFEVDCPGKSECYDRAAGELFNAATDHEVQVWPGITKVHIVVFEKGGQTPISETTVDPVPWDPPIKPNSCPTPSRATVTL